MASRSGLAPQVIAYWLMSSEMACRAASLISGGAAKSGKPWERLTALCCRASRVISRITDSVNCSALAEIMRREISAILDSGELICLLMGVSAALRDRCNRLCRCRINHPVHGGVTQHDLHVLAGLRKRNGFHQFGNFLVVAFGFPERDAVFAGVVGGQSVFGSSGQVYQAFEIISAEFDVV